MQLLAAIIEHDRFLTFNTSLTDIKKERTNGSRVMRDIYFHTCVNANIGS